MVKNWLKGNLFIFFFNSLVFDVVFEKIYETLCYSLQKEEDSLGKILVNLKLKNEFNPINFGQAQELSNCSFKKSSDFLEEINNKRTPFEKVDVLKQVNMLILKDIKSHLLSLNLAMELNERIMYASFMTTFLGSKMEHPLVQMKLMEYFLYVEYNAGETGLLIKTFIMTINDFQKITLNQESGIIEGPKEINLKDFTVTNFFEKKKKKALQKDESKLSKTALTYVKQYDDHFGQENFNECASEKLPPKKSNSRRKK